MGSNGNGKIRRLTGSQLRELRQYTGINQKDLAVLSDTPVTYLSFYEAGLRDLTEEEYAKVERAVLAELPQHKARVAQVLEGLARMA